MRLANSSSSFMMWLSSPHSFSSLLFVHCLSVYFYLWYVGGSDVASLASLCSEVVEYWNDIAVYFGTHRPHVTSELRLVTPLEGQVFDDAMMRPRFAVLRFILDLR